MKTISMNHTTPSKNSIRIVLVTALILLVPFVTMQFTNEVTWSWFDFVAAGTLLLAAGFAYEVMASKLSSNKSRVIVAVVLVAALALIWVQLAVGIFETAISGS
jgi:peptidoglycan/LPS O-acetylase OafA/YrhL